ncbi:MAG: hypothetical protein ABIZ34_07655, partial [Candidatus Limnocylindrales bacterium]
VFSVSALNAAATADPSTGKVPAVAPDSPPIWEEPPFDCLVPDPMPLLKNTGVGRSTSPGDPGDPDCGPIVWCEPAWDLPLPMKGAADRSWDSPITPGEPVPPVFDCPIPDPWPNDGATHVTPVPGVIDPHAVPIDHVSVSADGRTMTVYWWGGVRECNGLARVTVEMAPDGSLALTVLEGIMPGAEHMACIDIAMLLATDITLDTPIFTDGSGTQLPD